MFRWIAPVKDLVLYTSMLLMAACGGDKATNNDSNDNPLANTCWEYYQAKPISINDVVYIGDLRVEFVVEDTSYVFRRILLNNLPGVDSTQVEFDINNNAIVVESKGWMWLIEKQTERSFVYIMQQTAGQGWSFTEERWVTYPARDALLQYYIMDGYGDLQLPNVKYQPCGEGVMTEILLYDLEF